MRRPNWLSTALFIGSCAATAGCFEDSCVARGSLVDTPHGPRPIEHLRVGDLVYSIDLDTAEALPARVLAVRSARRELVALHAAGIALRCTSDHPIYDPEARAWAPAGDWVLGRRTRIALWRDGRLAMVALERVERFAGLDEVFDLTVDGTHHDFVADGVVVHNKSYLDECTLGEERVYEYDTCTCPDGSEGHIDCNPSTDEGTCECGDGSDASDSGDVP